MIETEITEWVQHFLGIPLDDLFDLKYFYAISEYLSAKSIKKSPELAEDLQSALDIIQKSGLLEPFDSELPYSKDDSVIKALAALQGSIACMMKAAAIEDKEKLDTYNNKAVNDAAAVRERREKVGQVIGQSKQVIGKRLSQAWESLAHTAEVDRDSLQKRFKALGGDVKAAVDIKLSLQTEGQFASLASTAGTLLDDTLEALKDTDALPDSVCLTILEVEFGVAVTIPKDFTNTHLPKVVAMFRLVPKDHVGHEKLKALSYQPLEEVGGNYSVTSATITLGDIESGMKEKYFLPYFKVVEDKNQTTKKQMCQLVPSLEATMLHEIGHAVDHKFGIMAKNGSKMACGNWQRHTLDEIIEIVLSGANVLDNLPAELTEETLRQMTRNALISELSDMFEQSTGAKGHEDWVAIEAMLTRCGTMRATKEPWNKVTVEIGGRAYHQSRPDQWVSYDTGARDSTFVSTYQWRAPGEWFAELYAMTWFLSRTPPKAVDAEVAAYLYQKK